MAGCRWGPEDQHVSERDCSPQPSPSLLLPGLPAPCSLRGECLVHRGQGRAQGANPGWGWGGSAPQGPSALPGLPTHALLPTGAPGHSGSTSMSPSAALPSGKPMESHPSYMDTPGSAPRTLGAVGTPLAALGSPYRVITSAMGPPSGALAAPPGVNLVAPPSSQVGPPARSAAPPLLRGGRTHVPSRQWIPGTGTEGEAHGGSETR